MDGLEKVGNVSRKKEEEKNKRLTKLVSCLSLFLSCPFRLESRNKNLYTKEKVISVPENYIKYTIELKFIAKSAGKDLSG